MLALKVEGLGHGRLPCAKLCSHNFHDSQIFTLFSCLNSASNGRPSSFDSLVEGREWRGRDGRLSLSTVDAQQRIFGYVCLRWRCRITILVEAIFHGSVLVELQQCVLRNAIVDSEDTHLAWVLGKRPRLASACRGFSIPPRSNAYHLGYLTAPRPPAHDTTVLPFPSTRHRCTIVKGSETN